MNRAPINALHVNLHTDTQQAVGRLALKDKHIYFEYDPQFIQTGIELSPLHLKLKPGLMRFEPLLFEGLPGLFNDSLPDGWGRLLLDRSMRQQGILPEQLSPLDRLAHVGNHGMGALTYSPDYSDTSNSQAPLELDTLATQANTILSGHHSDIIEQLLSLNGASAGARPKALIGLDADKRHIIEGAHTLSDDYQYWLLKFPTSADGLDAGAIEYVYSLMASAAGLHMSDCHLFESSQNAGYFATQRFDRNGNTRIHSHSVCGLLHTDFRTPALDYEDVLTLCNYLCRDIREVEKMYRLAVFNVLAHNRDDHAKNLGFIMNPQGEWLVSPAYDLTFSAGPRGEQSTMIMGEGAQPQLEHLIALGRTASLKPATMNAIIEQTQQAISLWPTLAKHYGVSAANRTLIKSKLTKL